MPSKLDTPVGLHVDMAIGSGEIFASRGYGAGRLETPSGDQKVDRAARWNPSTRRDSRRRPAAPGPLVAIGVLAVLLTACTSGEPDASNPSTTPPVTSVSTTAPAASSTTTEVLAPTTSMPPGRDDQLRALIEEWTADNDPVGVSVAVLFPDGDLWLGASGLAERDRKAAISSSDRFEIASITKTFMAVLTLRLVELGRVTLDDPISEFLPDFPAADEMTVRMLLGHRAGVFDPSAELVTDRFGPPDPYRVFTPDELLEAAAAGTPAFPPGTRHDYSNANYWVLAAVLEAATGVDTAALLNEYVIELVGLEDTLLFDSSLPEIEVVNAYSDLDRDGVPDPMGSRPLPGFVTPAWTAGGMISTATDLVEFLGGVFSGELITQASLEEMLDVTNGGGSYAMGIYRKNGSWGHDGGIIGYLSALFHDPRTGVTVAVLTNRFGPDAPQADVLAPRIMSLANGWVDS